MSRPVVVQKFGGTSLSTTDRIARAASRAVAARRGGADVVVVVSAMAGETDRLLGFARAISRDGSRREIDAVAAAGEQISAGLMALAIQSMGGEARSLLAHQLPLRTDATFGDAQIVSIGVDSLKAIFEAGGIPVVAGYQGVDERGNVTTLGRGGSDTTAVAVAAALGATCEIYTDVDGVYSIDPRLSHDGKLLSFVGYRTMRALAVAGAKVLAWRSVALAMDERVPLYVRSALEGGVGTLIGDDDDDRARGVFGVALAPKSGEARWAEVSVLGPDLAVPTGIVGHLARAGVSLFDDREVPHGRVFIVSHDDGALAARTLHALYGLTDENQTPRRALRAHGATHSLEAHGGRG